MSRLPRSILLAASIALLATVPSVAEQPCKPHLILENAWLSDAQELRRTWTAILVVDASRCAAPGGSFQVRFTRLKENAPDLTFSERFAWTQGRTEISLEFWADESVLDYAIDAVAPCTCRN
jgi:hypothetical protein